MIHNLFTIGHSTRPLDDFVALLHKHDIVSLVDVRRYPGSRRYPHFSRENLRRHLPSIGIDYLHLPELGGRRSPSKNSPNTAWRNEQFRGYADHMAGAEFAKGIEKLLGVRQPAAVMCAEAVPWKCHRQMIADELVRQGIDVIHILDADSTRRHELNPRAVDRGTHLEYPS